MNYRSVNDYKIFFDDGGVLNDNQVRGKQWQKHCGDFFQTKFGGTSKLWGEANYRLINKLMDRFWGEKHQNYSSFADFYKQFKIDWVNGMFEEIGVNRPTQINYEEFYDAVGNYVIPKVRSAIPGVIKCIKKLYKKGFALYTSSGMVSNELELYLEDMGVRHCFERLYGPDLVNTRKIDTFTFYTKIFKQLDLKPTFAIIIEDRPRFIRPVLKIGANVIQSCITGEFEPQFPYIVTKMKDLPKIIEQLIKDQSL